MKGALLIGIFFFVVVIIVFGRKLHKAKLDQEKRLLESEKERLSEEKIEKTHEEK